MVDSTLSIFVDESGRFQFPDVESPYYIVSMVFHDQRIPIEGLIAELDRHFAEMRLSNVTNMLLAAFKSRPGLTIEFAQSVKPESYKLFQLADMIATLKLVEVKLEHGEPLTLSENKFFGGPRKFKGNYLRFVKQKEIL